MTASNRSDRLGSQIMNLVRRRLHRAGAREDVLLERMRRREAEAIAEVAKSLTRGLDLGAVAQRIADHTRDLLDARAACVYRLDTATGDLVAIAAAGEMGATFALGKRLPKGTSVSGRAATERRVVSTTDVLNDPELVLDQASRDWVARIPHRAVLAAPLFAKGEVVGVLAAGDQLGRAFSDDDVRLAQTLADHAAIVLENAHLYAEAEQRRREAEHLRRVAAELTARLDVASVGQRVVETVMPVFDARAAGLRLVQADGSLVGIAFSGLMRQWFEIGHVAPAGTTVSGRAVADGRAVSTANVFSDPAIDMPDDVREGMVAAGDGAVLAVPLRTKSAIIGALSIADEPGRVFTPAEAGLLQAFADQAAVALERARLHEQTEARSAEIETTAARDRILAEASRVLAASLDVDTTLHDMTEVVVPSLADWCTVRVIERGGRMRRVATTCADPSKAHLIDRIAELVPTPTSGADGMIGEAIRSGRPLLLRDLDMGWLERNVRDRDYLALLRELAPQSVMMVPLVARGRTVGTITFVRTSDARRYDEADLAIARDLASRAALAIENARLLEQREQARLDAEMANRSKDEFLAVLSHELRTPLTSMLGWVRILRTTPPVAERLATGLEVIERNARAQAQLINDLLDVSRIVAGKLQLDRYPVDLDPVVMQAVDSLSGEAEAQKITIERVGSESRARVLGDPTRLHQILTNLISNAIKFTAAGGRVSVSLTRAADRARISVSDTGAGIAPELLPHVFDRFRQADSTTTRTHGGLGLGLAIVRHLVELHGGTVRAESPGTGQGATFVVELPLDVSPVTTGKPAATAAATELRLDGMRVLVVDDDPDTRELVRFVAEEHGATARAVPGAADALATLRLVTPDIIVTDLGMPIEDGYSFLRSLHALGPPVAQVPVVTLTAYAGAEDRTRALAAGFVAHVSKPVDPDTLVQVLVDVRRRRTR